MSVLLYLVFALVEVYSQTVPFVRFFDVALPNHSYVDFNLVGTGSGDSVQCHTDLPTCCRPELCRYRGDWYFPSGEILNGDSNIYERVRSGNVQVRRQNNATTAGIYRCEIETRAANGDSRETVYVGLYSSGGE